MELVHYYTGQKPFLKYTVTTRKTNSHDQLYELSGIKLS